MTRKSTLLFSAMGAALLPAMAHAQVPDMVAAFDAGGRAMGMGGATYQTGSDTLSGYYNPAGLGFVNKNTLGMTVRNMPESETMVTGDIAPNGTQFLTSTGKPGPTGLGHIGLAVPLGHGHGGTIELSLTRGGQLRDSRFAGPGLTEGGLNAAGYTQLLKSTTDFVNLSYGKATNDGTFSWGLGLVYAINRQVNFKLAPSGSTAFDEQATGLGAQVGFIVTPKDNPDVSFGASYRTAIKLKTGSASPLIYEEIPARLAAGIALRRNGFRGTRDYMVLGADVQHFFDGSDSQFIDRDQQTMFGLGVEYNYGMGGARIPIRFGFNFLPAGGDQFGQRNTFTFGVGYRPSNTDWGLDLNWARPSGGGSDFGIGVTYRFGN
jgi:hypothetical protein